MPVPARRKRPRYHLGRPYWIYEGEPGQWYYTFDPEAPEGIGPFASEGDAMGKALKIGEIETEERRKWGGLPLPLPGQRQEEAGSPGAQRSRPPTQGWKGRWPRSRRGIRASARSPYSPSSSLPLQMSAP